MAHINLLPWRETLRKKRKRDFLLQLLGAALIAGAALFLWYWQVQQMIEYQNGRNGYLRAEIKKVDKKIREIKDIEKKRRQLIARMNVIQNLQASRPLIVHLFDELVNTIPDGVYLDKLAQRGNRFTIWGKAQSNARVSAYMRNIDSSEWVKDAHLKIIKGNDKSPTALSHFELNAKQGKRNEKKKKGSQAKGKKGK